MVQNDVCTKVMVASVAVQQHLRHPSLCHKTRMIRIIRVSNTKRNLFYGYYYALVTALLPSFHRTSKDRKPENKAKLIEMKN
jgi:hypothetical protein